MKGTCREVVQLRRSNPCATLKSIGDTVHLTRERVRQILLSEGLPTRHVSHIQLYTCMVCDMPTKRREFCSRECRYEYTHPLVACDWCGNLTRKRQTELIYRISKCNKKHCFCNKLCQGKWLAENFGFGVNLGNRRNGCKRKYVYALICQQYRESGLSVHALAKKLGMVDGTIYRILRSEGYGESNPVGPGSAP